MGNTKKFQNSKLLERLYSKPEDTLFTLCYLIHSQKLWNSVLLNCIFKSIYKVVVCGGEGNGVCFVWVFFFSLYDKKDRAMV